MVFVTNDLQAKWDGTLNGIQCPSDVYFYKITFNGIANSEMKMMSGNITLLQ
jgi:hypothetical protein